MSQHPIEVILTRQLAEYLEIPVFMVNAVGDLLFFNEPAGQILGLQFDRTGAMPAAAWATIFDPIDADGVKLPDDDLPLRRTMRTGRPAMGRIYLQGTDGRKRHIEMACWSLTGHGHRNNGAVAKFWEIGT